MNPFTTFSVASLGNIGRWAVAPCTNMKFYIYTHIITHTCIITHTRPAAAGQMK